MEPFPFDPENYNESIIAVYKSFFAWLWRLISKRGKTTDEPSPEAHEKAEERECVTADEEQGL